MKVVMSVLKYHKSLSLVKTRSFIRHINTSRLNLTENDVEEIRIPVPWGHIAGKWWGNKLQRPILCIHGWQDNANTFNTLIPLLDTKYSYLAIDLPGHGLSSQIQKGFSYKTYEVVSALRKIQRYFDWKKMSLIGHSYGSLCSFLFSSLYPNFVDFYVAIDVIKPMSNNRAKEIKNGLKQIEKIIINDFRSLSSAPSYTKEDLSKRWIKGSNNSVTEKSCEILMERGAEIMNGLYKLRRDVRVKSDFAFDHTQEEVLKLAESITCNVLYIKAKDSPYFEREQNVLDVINVIRKHAKRFEEHTLPGSHHLHLNTPEIVAPVINEFFKSIEGQQ